VDLRRFFRTGADEASSRKGLGELFQKTRDLVPDRDEDEVKLIAGLAGLLGAVADADSDVTAAEQERIRSVLAERLGLDDLVCTAILGLIRDHRVQLFSLEGHIYARLINDVASRDQKLELLRLLFDLAAVDLSINAEEDHEIWLLADALKLSQRDLVDVRREFSRYRDVLKD
jgi:uncharacterized tellurite resistance protein B-like protein